MKRYEIFEYLQIDRYKLYRYMEAGIVVKCSHGNYEIANNYTKEQCEQLYATWIFNKRSEKMKKLWQNSEYRQKQSDSHVESTTRMWKDSEYREKTTKACNAVWTPEKCQEQSVIVTKALSTSQAKENLHNGQKRRWSNYTKDERELIRKHQQEAYDKPGKREEHSILMKSILAPKEMRLKMSTRTKEGQKRNNAIEKISKASTKMWQNPETIKKIYQKKHKNNSFNTSEPEKYVLQLLQQTFPDVQYQCFSEEYPFTCDFYIPSLDLYIEYHGTWTHGGRPFNETDESCIEQLSIWEEKAKTSKFYQNAIDTWTVRDVRKRQCAIDNNLNWLCFYSVKEVEEFLLGITKGDNNVNII